MIDRETLTRAWGLLNRRERRSALVLLAVSLMAGIGAMVMVGSVMPFLAVLSNPDVIERNGTLRWMYEGLGFESHYAFIVMLGLATIALIFLNNALQLLRTYAIARFSAMRGYSISSNLLRVYLSQPYDFFLNRHSGELSKSLLSESDQVARQFFTPLANAFSAVIVTLMIVALLVTINPGVALSVAAALAATFGIAAAFTRPRLRRMGRERVAANGERFTLAGTALQGIKDIKILGAETAYVNEFRRPALRIARIATATTLISAAPGFVVRSISMAIIILVILVMLEPEALAEGRPLAGLLPVLGAFALGVQRMMPEVQKLYQSLAMLRVSAAAVESICGDFELGKAAELDSPRMGQAKIPLTEGLTLEHAGFRYPGSDSAGLEGISLTVAAGERIGVVGATGAGKSTLADLIMGLLQPTEGRILVDGVPLESRDQVRGWRKSVGYVPQSIFLSAASVAENIALGIAPDEIDMGRVRRCTAMAQLDRFVEQDLPEGYDTLVGERGVRLSGGQRQRVGIARALYQDADLILFDEATSALDNATEREVIAAIESLPGTKTVIMIAHRLSTLRSCDRIAVLDRGRLVGLGPWDELARTSPIFAGLLEQAAV